MNYAIPMFLNEKLRHMRYNLYLYHDQVNSLFNSMFYNLTFLAPHYVI